MSETPEPYAESVADLQAKVADLEAETEWLRAHLLRATEVNWKSIATDLAGLLRGIIREPVRTGHPAVAATLAAFDEAALNDGTGSGE